jgi:hypothetical protein
VSGFGFALLRSASDPYPLLIDADACGKFGPVYPGGPAPMMGAKFNRLSLKPWYTSSLPLAGASGFTQAGVLGTATGRVTLAVAQRPDVELLNQGTQPPGFAFGRIIGPQNYNAVNNLPSGPFDGCNIRGATSVRVNIGPGGGQTILGGTVVWWWFDPFGGGWNQTDVQQGLPTGTTTGSPGELQIAYPYGRLFPEVRQFTSSGANQPTGFMYVFGEGGEYSIADLQL